MPADQDTPRRLIDAGLDLFARLGYDGVTTRMLAARAAVNQAAIPYHFGGKEGVYRAVVERVCDRLAPGIEALAANTRARRAAGEPAGEVLVAFMEGLCDAVLAPPGLDTPGWADGSDLASGFALFVREELSPSPAFDRIHQRLILPLRDTARDLLAELSGLPPTSPATLMLAHALLGQVGGFVSTRSSLLRDLGRPGDYLPEDAPAIRAAVGRLTRMLAAGATAVKSAP